MTSEPLKVLSEVGGTTHMDIVSHVYQCLRDKDEGCWLSLPFHIKIVVERCIESNSFVFILCA